MSRHSFLRRRAYLALGLMLLLMVPGAALLNQRSAGQDMTKAAQAFLETLSDEQRDQTLMDFDKPDRLGWHFIPKKSRKGLQLREMDEKQRKAALALLTSSLSEVGYQKSKSIMNLEQILQKLEGPKRRFARDYLRYYFTVFGKPTAKGKWGLSIEGHHLSLNFVVDGGKLVSHTPAFFGANPAVVKGDYGVGAKQGTRVLAAEEQLAFKLLHSLSSDQRKAAVIAEKAPADIRPTATGGTAQPPLTPPEGIAAAKLNESQLKILRALLAANAEKMRAERSERDLKAIEDAGVGKVHFAWAGADKEGIGHYYRLQGPTFLVEFCNTQPDPAGNVANHIHVVWRDTKNGDFGLPIKKSAD